MATIALILAALLVIGTIVMLVMAVQRRPGPIVVADERQRHPAPVDGGPSRDRGTVDRLEVGAEVQYDDREWVVIGAQRFAAVDGHRAWTAWHLDLKGQPGWIATVEGDDHLLFAVGAERPEAIDPADDPLTWRDVQWRRIAETAGGARTPSVEGERRRRRLPREPLTDHDVERVTYGRDELPRRRLVVERRVGDPAWAAWIGDRVPVTAIHVTRWSA